VDVEAEAVAVDDVAGQAQAQRAVDVDARQAVVVDLVAGQGDVVGALIHDQAVAAVAGEDAVLDPEVAAALQVGAVPVAGEGGAADRPPGGRGPPGRAVALGPSVAEPLHAGADHVQHRAVAGQDPGPAVLRALVGPAGPRCPRGDRAVGDLEWPPRASRPTNRLGSERRRRVVLRTSRLAPRRTTSDRDSSQAPSRRARMSGRPSLARASARAGRSMRPPSSSRRSPPGTSRMP
jgi:hypothetical protein